MKRLKYALKCIATHAEATVLDAKGLIFVYRSCCSCNGCNQTLFCGKVMVLLEKELNDRAVLERLLKR